MGYFFEKLCDGNEIYDLLWIVFDFGTVLRVLEGVGGFVGRVWIDRDGREARKARGRRKDAIVVGEGRNMLSVEALDMQSFYFSLSSRISIGHWWRSQSSRLSRRCKIR